jgi:hypothetical protein
MDIYSLINSKDVSAHCRSIGHAFTSAEAAFLVYFNKKLTVEGKHRAWEEIIGEMPDMEIQERLNCPRYGSLRRFLKDYMALENKVLDCFHTAEPDAVYSYSTDYDDENGRLFASLEDVFRAVEEDAMDKTIYRLHLQKRGLGEEGKAIRLCETPQGETAITTIKEFQEADWELWRTFDGMWFEIPTPFQKGDILIGGPFYAGENVIFALDSLSYWNKKIRKRLIEYGDTSDMSFSGYFVNDDTGRIYCDNEERYQDLEYYRGALSGYNRLLRAVSNFLKGEIDFVLLLSAYDVILAEEKAKDNANACDDGRHKERFMRVNAAASGVYDFHAVAASFEKIGEEKALTEPPHI